MNGTWERCMYRHVQTQKHIISKLARWVMESVNCAPARRVKICWWLALLKLWRHTGVEKGQMDEAQKRNMFRHIKTEKFVCMWKSELAERQFSAQAEVKWLVARQVIKSSNCAPGRRLKMCWRVALLSLWGHTGIEKRQMDETQKRRHFQTYSN